MGPAATDAEIETVGGADQVRRDTLEFLAQALIVGVDAAGDLDHALGHLEADGAREGALAEQADKVTATRNEVEIAGRDELQLKLDAKRQKV